MTTLINAHGQGTIPLLDHGSVTLRDWLGNDERVLEAARVSTGAASKGERQDERLLRFLLKHKHTSPFQHVLFTFIVTCPIFVQRQWARHRTWQFTQINEESGRYRDQSETLEFYVPEVAQIGFQPPRALNQQGRLTDEVTPEAQDFVRGVLLGQYERAAEHYKLLIGVGVARELARLVLPVATYTTFYATVDLHNLLHFLDLRTHAGAQYEMVQYALAIQELSKRVAPKTFAIWEEFRGA